MKRWFVSVAALGFACGGDSTGPSAASVTGIAGDNQSAPRGATLPAPLSFTALGSDGLPIEGVSVTWSATPASAAAFAPTTGTTDSNGFASTNVVLGTTLGTITIQATLSGVSPVIYHATVLDPCDLALPYSIGNTVNGSLATTDCLVQSGNLGWYYDYYALNLPSGQHSVRLKMHGAGSFDDTYLDLFTDAGAGVAFDDDSILGLAGARNAQLDIVMTGGSYFIGANSFDPFTTGSYTLSSETRPAAMNGCREVWLTRGVTISDSITSSDCADSSATPKRYDVARIVVFSGTVLTITQRSLAINPSLLLYQANFGQTLTRTLVAQNDDSLPGTNDDAFIQYTVTASHVYDVIIGASTAGETGAYTFEVSASTTLSPLAGSRVGASVVGQGRDNWWRDVGVPKRSKH